MKTAKKTLTALFFFFYAYFTANAVPDSCLKMIYPNDYRDWSNPDSIKVDSCFDSPTYEKWYSKYGYFFGTTIYILNPKPISESDRKRWWDIDSQFATTRAGFELLEQKFGEYTIRRYEFGGNDSIHLEAPAFVIDFKNYHLVDSVIYYIEKIDSVIGCQLDKIPYALSVQGYNYNNDNFEIIMTQSLLTIVFADNYLSKLNSNQIRIEIFNLTGNRVKNIKFNINKSIEIDMNDFVPGIYFLKIDNNFVKYIKF